MRPVFFAPWWWFVWSSGKRFSLRRALSLAAGIVIAAEVIVAGVRYAFHGEIPTPATALAVASASGIASLGYSLVEPLFVIARDSLASRRFRPERLRDVSYGLQTAYAVGLAYASYVLAPHVPALSAFLLRARVTSGPGGGNARYLIGASIVFLPIVIIARVVVMQMQSEPNVVGSVTQTSRRPIPTVDRTRIPSPPVPEPTQVSQRHARIVNVEIGPAKSEDHK